MIIYLESKQRYNIYYNDYDFMVYAMSREIIPS